MLEFWQDLVITCPSLPFAVPFTDGYPELKVDICHGTSELPLPRAMCTTGY